MERSRGAGLLGLLVILVLAGCGSSSGSDRSKLLDQLHTRLTQSNSTLNSPDLVNCIVSQAGSLPTDQLKTAANASANGNNDSPAQEKVALKLAAPCVAEGHGAAALKTQVLSSIESNLTSLPAAYANCVDAKAKAMSNGQLATILQAGENGQTALHNAGVAIGRQYGNECLGNPAALAEMRALFLKPIRQSVSQYSPAFASCLLSEAEALPSNTLRSLILNPSTASAKSAALGKGWAQKCVQKGIKP